MRLELAAWGSPPAELRERYFRSLLEGQVTPLKERVAASRTFACGGVDPEDAGYAAIHEGAIVEFFAGDGWLPRLREAFHAAADEAGASSAVVKSYDTLAIVAATRRTVQGGRAVPESGELLADLRAELIRQREAVRSVGVWYLAPLVPGMPLLLLGRWFQSHATRWSLEADHFIILLVSVVAVLVFLVAWLLNQRAVERPNGGSTSYEVPREFELKRD